MPDRVTLLIDRESQTPCLCSNLAEYCLPDLEEQIELSHLQKQDQSRYALNKMSVFSKFIED